MIIHIIFNFYLFIIFSDMIGFPGHAHRLVSVIVMLLEINSG
jgi:hypothetical protein